MFETPAALGTMPPPWSSVAKRLINVERPSNGAYFCSVQVMSDHLLATLKDESAEIFRIPKPGQEASWAGWLPFPLVAVFCESDAGLANAGKSVSEAVVPTGSVGKFSRSWFFVANIFAGVHVIGSAMRVHSA